MGKDYFIGCDVGTGSARAGVFDKAGNMLSMQTKEIQMWRPAADFVEQSLDNMWQACCITIKKAVKEASINPEQIGGIGFDATCSLVVLDEQGRPVRVSPDEPDQQNVMVWMDHRSQMRT
ncbi:MAG: FGGY family carbohydrate kinase [Balneolaceae bacterium]